MFDTVILLSSALERAIFMTVLSEHNPFLTIIPVETLACPGIGHSIDGDGLQAGGKFLHRVLNPA